MPNVTRWQRRPCFPEQISGSIPSNRNLNHFPPAQQDVGSSRIADKASKRVSLNTYSSLFFFPSPTKAQTCRATLRSSSSSRAARPPLQLHPPLRRFEHLATRLRPSCYSSARSNHIQISFGLLASTEAQRSGCNNGCTYPPKYHRLYVYFIVLWRFVSA